MWRKRGKPEATAKPQPSAYGKALGLLSRRERSTAELTRKLKYDGYEADESTAALDKLTDQQFLDDDRFAGALARTRAGQGHGPRRIAHELRGHGLSQEALARLFEAEGFDWIDIARRQFKRRYGNKPAPDKAESGRRAGFLLRRGFDAATVRTITHADDVDDSADDFD